MKITNIFFTLVTATDKHLLHDCVRRNHLQYKYSNYTQAEKHFLFRNFTIIFKISGIQIKVYYLVI
jgi:hypothetical protein